MEKQEVYEFEWNSKQVRHPGDPLPYEDYKKNMMLTHRKGQKGKMRDKIMSRMGAKKRRRRAISSEL